MLVDSIRHDVGGSNSPVVIPIIDPNNKLRIMKDGRIPTERFVRHQILQEQVWTDFPIFETTAEGESDVPRFPVVELIGVGGGGLCGAGALVSGVACVSCGGGGKRCRSINNHFTALLR